MSAKFTMDVVGVGEMLRASWMQAEMHRRADEGRVYGEAVGPIGDPVSDPHAGRYKDSFVVSSGSAGGYEHDRAYGRLENTSEEALWVEVGSKNNDAHHVLARALDVMGS